MSITIYPSAYGGTMSYNSSGVVDGFYNQDGTITYLAPSTGTVIPIVGSTPTQLVTADAGSGNTVSSLRITVNPGDDTIAGRNLLDVNDQCFVISSTGQALKLTLGAAASRVHIIAMSSSTTYTGAAYVAGTAETDLSDFMANDLRCDFDTADNVRELYITWGAGSTTRTGLISVLGLKY